MFQDRRKQSGWSDIFFWLRNATGSTGSTGVTLKMIRGILHEQTKNTLPLHGEQKGKRPTVLFYDLSNQEK